MPDELGISVSYPLPGTRFYDSVKSELGMQQNWQDSDDLAMLFKGPFRTSYYRALYLYVHSDWAMRRSLRNLRTLRKAAALLYFATRSILLAGAMAVLSRLPHQGFRPMGAALNPQAAAKPTEQSDD